MFVYTTESLFVRYDYLPLCSNGRLYVVVGIVVVVDVVAIGRVLCEVLMFHSVENPYRVFAFSKGFY